MFYYYNLPSLDHNSCTFLFQVSRQVRMLGFMLPLLVLTLSAMRESPWSFSLRSSMSRRLTVVVDTSRFSRLTWIKLICTETLNTTLCLVSNHIYNWWSVTAAKFEKHCWCDLRPGPDICGYSTKKVHVIFNYKGKNHLIKKEIKCKVILRYNIFSSFPKLLVLPI